MRNTFLALALAALPLVAACDDDPEPNPTGDLQVTYRIGSGSTNCEDEGIDSVTVFVMTGTTVVEQQLASCDPEDQSVMFQDLPVGTYTIRAEGRTDDIIVYTGEIATPITVVADTTNGPELVILNQIPPALELYFDFEDVGNCATFGVITLRVVVYVHGGTIEFDQEYDCEEQLNLPVLIEDLNETSTYDLRVRGANDNGEYLYAYDEDEIVVAPGPPTQIEAALAACAGICPDP